MISKTVGINQVAVVASLVTVAFVVYLRILSEFHIRLPLEMVRDWPSTIVVSVVAVALLFMTCRVIDYLTPGWRRPVKNVCAIFLVGCLYMVAYVVLTGQPIDDIFAYILPLIVIGVAVYFALYADKQWELSRRDVERRPNWVLNNPQIRGHLESIPADRAAGILEYYRRAEALMEKAGSVLWVIIVVLMFTAVFIIFAGRISEIGVVETDHLAHMVAERAEIEDQIERLDEEIDRSDRQVEMMVGRIRLERDDQKEFERLSDVLKHLETRARSVAERRKGPQSRVETYDTQIWSARNLALERGRVGSGESKGQTKTETNTASGLLVASTVTRLGVAIVAIYLVQILLSLYRYNTRMAADYLAHADTLMFVGLDAKAVKALHAVLLPKVNYGKMPSTVFQRSTDAVRTRLRRRGVPGGDGGSGDDNT